MKSLNELLSHQNLYKHKRVLYFLWFLLAAAFIWLLYNAPLFDQRHADAANQSTAAASDGDLPACEREVKRGVDEALMIGGNYSYRCGNQVMTVRWVDGPPQSGEIPTPDQFAPPLTNGD